MSEEPRSDDQFRTALGGIIAEADAADLEGRIADLEHEVQRVRDESERRCEAIQSELTMMRARFDDAIGELQSATEELARVRASRD